MVSPYFPAHGGGVEIVADHIAHGLGRLGFQVLWAASDCDNPPAPTPGVNFLPMTAWNAVERRYGVPFPLWAPSALKKLLDAVRRSDIVIIHESLYVSHGVVGLIAKLCGRPLVLVQHVGPVPYKNRVLRLLVNCGNRTLAAFIQGCAHKLVFVSESVKDYFCHGAPERCAKSFLIPNGVDIDRFKKPGAAERLRLKKDRGISPKIPVVLFVGRFVEKKGLALLKELTKVYSRWQWVFVGAGPLDPSTWGRDNVRVAGFLSQDELLPWYQAADLLILPSVGEGFPLVVQEAMATGLPMALSSETAVALPGVAQRVHHAPVSGDPATVLRDWTALLAQAVAQKAQHECAREQLSRFARENWSWQTCCEAYGALVCDVAAVARHPC